MKNTSAKRTTTPVIILAVLCIASMLLSGCIRVKINEPVSTVEEMLANEQLVLDPVDYNADGEYTFTVHYDKGGFKNMDLRQAYVAFYPVSEDVITEDNISKIAVITIVTSDDNTLSVNFTDDEPDAGKAYCFIIPEEGLAGSVIPTV